MTKEVVEKGTEAPKKRRMKRKGQRTFSVPEVFAPSDYVLETITSGLTKYYTDNPSFIKNGDTIEGKIAEVVKKSKEGWKCAPKTFEGRISTLTKYNTEALKTRFDYEPNYPSAQSVRLQKELKKDEKKLNDFQVFSTSQRKALSTEERKHIVEIEKQYLEEFEFNRSSDIALLRQLILEELQQFRLTRRRIEQDPGLSDINIEDELDRSNIRLIKAQQSLGITRKQRDDSNANDEGNVAHLAKLYEEKVKRIQAKEEADLLEEQTMMKLHSNLDGLKELDKIGMSDMADSLRAAHASEDLTEDTLESILEEDHGDEKETE
jgi:hypothetical protein